MLFCYGVKMEENDFEDRVLKSMKNNQSNQILFVYLDSHRLVPYEFKDTDLWLPQLQGSWHNFMTDYGKLHGLKKSRTVEIERIKVKGKSDFIKLKFAKKIDKKLTVNKTRPKTILESQFYGKIESIRIPVFLPTGYINLHYRTTSKN